MVHNGLEGSKVLIDASGRKWIILVAIAIIIIIIIMHCVVAIRIDITIMTIIVIIITTANTTTSSSSGSRLLDLGLISLEPNLDWDEITINKLRQCGFKCVKVIREDDGGMDDNVIGQLKIE